MAIRGWRIWKVSRTEDGETRTIYYAKPVIRDFAAEITKAEQAAAVRRHKTG